MENNELHDRMMNLLEDVSGDPSVRDHMDDDPFELGFFDPWRPLSCWLA